MNIEITSLSSKGQVVIPTKIRNQMGLNDGIKFMVLTDGENVLLKPLVQPTAAVFKELVKKSRSLVRKYGIKKTDVAKTIKDVRHENRS